MAAGFGIFGAAAAFASAEGRQFSPLSPGAAVLEDVAPGTLAEFVISAPPGTLERRYALALALRALRPGAPLTAFAPKSKGGGRIEKELEAFGCSVTAESRCHRRFCRTLRPTALPPEIDAAIADGAPRFAGDLGLWTQPGIFSWDRIDAGTKVLLAELPSFSGRGADVGCGLGVLAKAVLGSPAVTQLDLIDIDRRAVNAARRNVQDPRAAFHWADVRALEAPQGLDFVVMNPPFHDGGNEDRALGAAFVRRAQRLLKGGGKLWLVANRHLPYESVLGDAFGAAALKTERDGYKVYEAQK